MTTSKTFKTSKLYDVDVDTFLVDAVSINELEIDREIVEISAQLAYWNHRYADATRAFMVAKVDSKRIRSRRQVEIRTDLERKARLSATETGAKSSARPFTEAQVEALVDGDIEVQEAENDLIDAEVNLKRLSGYCDAIRVKADMVRSISARLRAELERGV
jgi:nitrogenase molybdenum-iron protein alpha/beta subunit